MSNKKDWMLNRLSRLVKLCKSTEPDRPDDTSLFTVHNIDAHSMYARVDNEYNGLDAIEMVDLMKTANRIWRIRRKIWNGDWDTDMEAEMHDGIEDLLEQGQKINAIKYYRNAMKTIFVTDVSLRESKDYVDTIESDLISRGIIKK
jgi:ribosomal protein L7/L12